MSAGESVVWEACKEYWVGEAGVFGLGGTEGLARWEDRESGIYCAKGRGLLRGGYICGRGGGGA